MNLSDFVIHEKNLSDHIQLKTKIPPKAKKTTPFFMEWFIKGPISGPWIAKAASLPGHSLHVALAIYYIQGCTGKSTVTLTRREFDKFSTRKNSASRALNCLAQAGLICCTRVGHRFKINILNINKKEE